MSHSKTNKQTKKGFLNKLNKLLRKNLHISGPSRNKVVRSDWDRQTPSLIVPCLGKLGINLSGHEFPCLARDKHSHESFVPFVTFKAINYSRATPISPFFRRKKWKFRPPPLPVLSFGSEGLFFPLSSISHSAKGKSMQ